jgi:putative ABC transport system permease protein
MIYGRFLNQVDIDDNRKVTVISEDVYKQLFEKDVNPIGEYLLINDINFKVIGMFKDQRSGGPRSDIHIPFTTFKQVYNMGNKIGWMMITGKPAYDIGQIELDATLLLKNIHKIHPNDTKAFGSFNLGKRFKELTGFLIGMQFLTWFVGIATLIAGVFAIGNILLITVKERTKEIGVRRALGATPFEIKRQVVLEALALTIISGLLGIISGGLILMLIDAQQSTAETPFLVNPSVSIPIVFLAVIILVVLGTLIGLIPANKATSIKPIDALREE